MRSAYDTVCSRPVCSLSAGWVRCGDRRDWGDGGSPPWEAEAVVGDFVMVGAKVCKLRGDGMWWNMEDTRLQFRRDKSVRGRAIKRRDRLPIILAGGELLMLKKALGLGTWNFLHL
jgi:hypothetical protein